MPSAKTNFLDKVLGRIGRLDSEGLQTVVQRLARERSFLETLFNTIEDGVLVVDEHGRILYFNQAVTNLIGLQHPEAEGQSLSRYLPQIEWGDVTALDQAGGRRVLRQEFEVAYPRHRYLRLYAAPLDGEASGSSGVALILHDTTEARQRTVEAIESERIQALTLLAASVAHEIGNPLNALHIHLQLMQRELRRGTAVVVEPSPPGRLGSRRLRAAARGAAEAAERAELFGKLEKYLEVAQGEIARLDYIVTQFLQAIRPTTPQRRPTSLNDTITETVALLRPEIENRGQTVELRLSRSLPQAPVDPVQVKQALVNLMKNAMQAMSKGGVLTLETGSAHEGIWVSVADTGSGISSDRVNRIFEPFYTTKKRGSGLGLMIVQRIVRDHGGLVKVDSRLGQGTTFRLWFPLYEPQPRLLEAHARD